MNSHVRGFRRLITAWAIPSGLVFLLSIPSIVAETEPQVTRPAGKASPQVEPGLAAPGSPASEDSAKPPVAEVVHSAPECLSWPRPPLTLFLTGRQHGYIEPCGCTGLENAKGGLSRRASLLDQLRQKGWDLVALDLGNQVRRFGVQSEIKFQTTATSLREMKYDAIAFGPDDLRLSIGELTIAVAGDGNEPKTFVCCNVNVLDENVPFRVIERNGIRVGITAVLGRGELRAVQSDEIEQQDPAAALQLVLPKLLEARCHLHVLLAHASLIESRELARKFPQFGIVVTAGGAGEPTREPELVEGTKSRMVQVGTKGMYVGVVGLFPNQQPAMRYERIELDAQFPDSPPMLELFELYQKQLENQGFAGLGVKATKHPTRSGTYVGSESCGECHTKAYEVWEGTPHAHATMSISEPTQRSDIPRHHDPECLSCHVTGWNPQGFFPYLSGYMDLKESAHLHGNGCENCHGPGSEHYAVENGDLEVSDEQRDKLRLAMRVSLEDARKSLCYECHDIDNSPDFDFDSYWEQIVHPGKD